MAIAFFDVDHTLVRGSTAFHCARLFRREGLLSGRFVVEMAWAHVQHHLGVLDFDRAYIRGIQPFVGRPAAELGRLMQECFETHVRPNLFRDGIERVRRHHEEGDRVVLISASSHYLLQTFRDFLPVDDVLGFRQNIRDGVMAADFVRPIPYGPNKLPLAEEMARDAGESLADCHFYTDNSADLPLLRAVGHPYAVNPNFRLRREARSRGWPILKFTGTIRDARSTAACH
ncbi:MAG: HAD-IB family hydrolase [Deltaproteobacteria bacterium]|nr:HAD-IB family hydrolase [Deltaproteobacteria bacterium]